MTRAEFIKGYAERSGLSAKWANLGFIEIDGSYLIALPCACSDESCEGWTVVSPTSVSSHLELYAPEPLRTAFIQAIGREALRKEGGE